MYMGMVSLIKCRRVLFFSLTESSSLAVLRIEKSKSKPNKIFMKQEATVVHGGSSKRENMNSKVFSKFSLKLL